jgi:hypothetical protein
VKETARRRNVRERRTWPYPTALIVGLAAAIAVPVILWQTSDSPHTSSSVVRPSSVSSSAPVAGPRAVPEAAFASQPPFTGPAVKEFGQAALQAAYRQAVNFAFDVGWNPALIGKRKSTLTRADFAAPLRELSAASAKSYNALVGRALTGQAAAIRSLEAASLFSVAGRSGSVEALSGASAVTGRRFTRAEVGVDRSAGAARMSISFTAKATVHLRDAAGKQFVMDTARSVRYLLVPNPAAAIRGVPFLIDAWSNHLQTSALRAA